MIFCQQLPGRRKSNTRALEGNCCLAAALGGEYLIGAVQDGDFGLPAGVRWPGGDIFRFDGTSLVLCGVCLKSLCHPCCIARFPGETGLSGWRWRVWDGFSRGDCGRPVFLDSCLPNDELRLGGDDDPSFCIKRCGGLVRLCSIFVKSGVDIVTLRLWSGLRQSLVLVRLGAVNESKFCGRDVF